MLILKISKNLGLRAAKRPVVVVQFRKKASRARDYRVTKPATLRAARPDSSLRKERLLRMTIRPHHHRSAIKKDHANHKNVPVTHLYSLSESGSSLHKSF
jgi:hypothetical protein